MNSNRAKPIEISAEDILSRSLSLPETDRGFCDLLIGFLAKLGNNFDLLAKNDRENFSKAIGRMGRLVAQGEVPKLALVLFLVAKTVPEELRKEYLQRIVASDRSGKAPFAVVFLKMYSNTSDYLHLPFLNELAENCLAANVSNIENFIQLETYNFLKKIRREIMLNQLIEFQPGSRSDKLEAFSRFNHAAFVLQMKIFENSLSKRLDVNLKQVITQNFFEFFATMVFASLLSLPVSGSLEDIKKLQETILREKGSDLERILSRSIPTFFKAKEKMCFELCFVFTHLNKTSLAGAGECLTLMIVDSFAQGSEECKKNFIGSVARSLSSNVQTGNEYVYLAALSYCRLSDPLASQSTRLRAAERVLSVPAEGDLKKFARLVLQLFDPSTRSKLISCALKTANKTKRTLNRDILSEELDHVIDVKPENVSSFLAFVEASYAFHINRKSFSVGHFEKLKADLDRYLEQYVNPTETRIELLFKKVGLALVTQTPVNVYKTLPSIFNEILSCVLQVLSIRESDLLVLLLKALKTSSSPLKLDEELRVFFTNIFEVLVPTCLLYFDRLAANFLIMENLISFDPEKLMLLHQLIDGKKVQKEIAQFVATFKVAPGGDLTPMIRAMAVIESGLSETSSSLLIKNVEALRTRISKGLNKDDAQKVLKVSRVLIDEASNPLFILKFCNETRMIFRSLLEDKTEPLLFVPSFEANHLSFAYERYCHALQVVTKYHNLGLHYDSSLTASCLVAEAQVTKNLFQLSHSSLRLFLTSLRTDSLPPELDDLMNFSMVERENFEASVKNAGDRITEKLNFDSKGQLARMFDTLGIIKMIDFLNSKEKLNIFFASSYFIDQSFGFETTNPLALQRMKNIGCSLVGSFLSLDNEDEPSKESITADQVISAIRSCLQHASAKLRQDIFVQIFVRVSSRFLSFTSAKLTPSRFLTVFNFFSFFSGMFQLTLDSGIHQLSKENLSMMLSTYSLLKIHQETCGISKSWSQHSCESCTEFLKSPSDVPLCIARSVGWIINLRKEYKLKFTSENVKSRKSLKRFSLKNAMTPTEMSLNCILLKISMREILKQMSSSYSEMEGTKLKGEASVLGLFEWSWNIGKKFVYFVEWTSKRENLPFFDVLGSASVTGVLRKFRELVESNEGLLHKKKSMDAKTWWDVRTLADERLKGLIKELEEGLGPLGALLGLGKSKSAQMRFQLKKTRERIYAFLNERVSKFWRGSELLANWLNFFASFCVAWGYQIIAVAPLKITLADISFRCMELERMSGVALFLVKDALQDLEVNFRDLVELQDRGDLFHQGFLKRLLLDEDFYQFPLESLKVFSRNLAFPSRILNLFNMRSEKARVPKEFHQKVVYVLNPSGDLTESETRLSPVLKSRVFWVGFEGSSPFIDLVIDKLKEGFSYLYLGHGAGEKYLNSYKLDTLKNLETVVMLMGCASAQLINPDEAKNRKKNFHGIIADYVSSDVVCAMGNLWSVTDRDSDLITLDILEKWDGIEENTSLETLNMIAKRARKNCRLRKLNGSSLVCFNLYRA